MRSDLIVEAKISLSPHRHTTPGRKKIVPLPQFVLDHYAAQKDALLRSRPPCMLISMDMKESTKLPFVEICAVIHPFSHSNPGHPVGRLQDPIPTDVSALWDTGAEISRVCADIINVDMESGEFEPVVMSFEYVPMNTPPISSFILILPFRFSEFDNIEICAPALLIPRQDLPLGGEDTDIILGQKVHSHITHF